MVSMTEPAWLTAQRDEAARAFAALPMPTQKLRPWKYTDVSHVDLAHVTPDAWFLPVVEATPPQGGWAGTFTDALTDSGGAELVRKYLGSLVPSTEGKFIAANAANWNGGALVYAPRGKAYDAPVTVRLDAPRGGGVFPRLLIVAEPASEVTVIVRATSGAAETLASGVVEVIAQADSRVRVVFDLRWGAATDDFTLLRTRTERGANVAVATVAVGGRIVKQTLEALLEGEGSSAQFKGVALGDESQHFDFVTLQDHIGPKTISDVQIKTALAGASRSVYYGITRVEETASGASAEQANRNLLLSKHAKADADPVLEILTNEVIRCGHGATVGPVDQEAFFYLQSRGLDRRQALQLLVVGFFQSVLTGMGDEALAEEVAAAVTAKLGGAEL